MRVQKLGKIGSGGFGVVYEAALSTMSGRFAIKELSGSHFSSEDRARFAREARIQSALQHSNVLPVVMSDMKAEPPWFAMPLAVCSLADQIGALAEDIGRLHHVFRQILQGVKYAHDNGVIHRDLKPENILLFNGDQVKIADFGLGKRLGPDASTTVLTSSAEIGGTFCYAAPEQMLSLKAADMRSDIYSLGKILYEALAGRPGFPDVDLSLVDGRYRFLVAKCCVRDPDRRYQSVDELIADFERVTGDDTLFREPAASVRAEMEALLVGRESATAIAKLDRLLVEQSHDEDVYLQLLPKVRAELLQAYLRHSPEGFRRALEQYDHYLGDTALAFEYCDVAALFYAEVYERLDDPAVRALTLGRLLDMGIGYNRWFVQGVFCRLVGSIRDHSTALVVLDIIRGEPDAIRQLASQLLDEKPIRIIRDAIVSLMEPDEPEDDAWFREPDEELPS